MAVTEQTPLITHTGNGVSTQFAYNFLVLAGDDLVVTVTGRGTQANGIDYTVTGVGLAGGGMVTFTVAPAAAAQVVLYRDTPLSRDQDYQVSGDLLAAVVNRDFDRMILILQEIFGGGKGVVNALRVPNGESVPALPSAADRANRLLAFDATGQQTLLFGAAVDSATALQLALADPTSAANGAGMVAFDPALNYAARTIGAAELGGFVKVEWFLSHAERLDVINRSAAINIAPKIQAAISFLPHGGTVLLPRGLCNIGSLSPAITVPFFVRLIGHGDAYHNTGFDGQGGTELLYAGVGVAIQSQGMSIHMSDFSLRASAPSGTAMAGIRHDGGWLCSWQRITIKNFPRANGYAFEMTSGPVGFGAYFCRLEQVDCAGLNMRFNGRNGGDGITTLSIVDCTAAHASFTFAQGVIHNGAYEGWTTGNGLSFDDDASFTLNGVDIEGPGGGPGTAGIFVSANSNVFETGTIWAGYTGHNRVIGTLRTRVHGPLDVQQQLTVNVATKLFQAGQQAVSNGLLQNFISDYLVPTNLIGGAQTAHRQWRRFVGGAEYVDHDWQEHAFIRKDISTTALGAVTIATIPVANADGLRIEAHAHGQQIGDAAYSNSRRCNVSNNAGTLVITQEPQVSSGSGGAISFVAAGQSVLVQWSPTTANASTGAMNIEIRGAWTSHS